MESVILPRYARFFCGRLKRRPAPIILPGKLPPGLRLMKPAGGKKIAASRVLVAVKEASPVGFITTVDDYIDLLFVSPDYSRQGIASALLNALLIRPPERVLTVEASITAKPFFERHGFSVIEQQQVEARGERFLNYRMRREIDALNTQNALCRSFLQ